MEYLDVDQHIMFAARLSQRAEKLLAACRQQNIKIATAESCTGGLIAGCLTAIAGSSDVVERGFVTYSNDAKIEMIGVPVELINELGAVSEPVSRAMAEGALKHSNAALSIAVTGVAGPNGGSAEKPVGLVHISCALKGSQTAHERCVFSGDRDAVRDATIETALDMAIATVSGHSASA